MSSRPSSPRCRALARALRGASLALSALVLVSGCYGPVTSTKRIMDAETALERSRVADAPERAPYEYYMADELLYKAKEEWGYSDFQAAERYAEEARRQAERSLTKAKEDPFTGSPVDAGKLEAARRGVKPEGASEGASDPSEILEDVNAMEEERQ